MFILSLRNKPLTIVRGVASFEERKARFESKVRLFDYLLLTSVRRVITEHEELYKMLLEVIVDRFELSFLAPVLWLGNNPQRIKDHVLQNTDSITLEERRIILTMFYQAMRSEIRAERQSTVSPSWSRLVSNDNSSKG